MTRALFIVFHLIFLNNFVCIFELLDRILEGVEILEQMIPIVSIFFTIFTLSTGTSIHLRVFDQVKLRHVGASDSGLTQLAFGKLHKASQILNEVVNILLIIVENYLCVTAIFLIFCQSLLAVTHVLEKFLFLVFETLLVGYQGLKV